MILLLLYSMHMMQHLSHSGVQNAITLIISVCQNMSLYVEVDNMLMPSFVSVCVHVCLSSLCLLPIL